MNRIYYQGSFKLATDWPEEPKPNAFGRVHLLREDSYRKAIASAMENGVEFESQDKVKHYVFAQIPNYIDYKFKDGDNWDCPENVEIGYQVLIQKTWHSTPKENYDKWSSNGTEPHYREVAIFKSESVEKKESDLSEEEIDEITKHHSLDQSKEIGDNDKFKTNPEVQEWLKTVSEQTYDKVREILDIIGINLGTETKIKIGKVIDRLTAPESSPAPLESDMELLNECHVYLCYQRDVRLNRDPELIDLIKMIESNPKLHEVQSAPLESQEELWEEVFSKIPPHNLDDFERRLELLKSKFILTRRTEGDLQE